MNGPRPLLIGVGNPQRADDGVGLAVAQRIIGRCDARVLLQSGDALALIDEWYDAGTVVLIDAAAARGAPGRITRFEISALADPDPLPNLVAPASTHAFGVAEAIHLSRVLGRLPRRLILYAIEGACFQAGAAMSAAVQAAGDRAVEMIAAELRCASSALHSLCGVASVGAFAGLEVSDMTSREPWQPHIDRQSEFNPFDTTPKENVLQPAPQIRKPAEDTAPLQGTRDVSDSDSLEDVIADAHREG